MKTRNATIFILASWPMLLIADPITFTGVVKTQLPTLTVSPTDDLVSDVKEFSLKPTQDAGICKLVADEALAKNHSSKYSCLIKWTEAPGITQDSIGIKGLMSGAGLKTFQYSVSIFDNGEFKPFYEGSTNATFIAPSQPSVPSVLSNWSIRGDSTETSHTLYNRKEEMVSLTLTAEPRNYDQVAHFNGQTCTILTAKTSCKILVNKTFLTTQLEAGTDKIPYFLTDKYDFFQPHNQDFSFVWDFRSPTIEKYYVNANDNRLPMIINDYGEPFVLYPDQAAVVVTSPHSSLPGDWWYPTDPSLKLKIADGFKMTKTLNYEANPVTFNLNLRDPDVAFNAKPIGKPKQLGEKLIYTYDFKDVEDGLYDFTISTLDVNLNGKEEVYAGVFVDRLPPDLQFVVNKKQNISKNINVYSLSDLTAMTWGGWQDGSEIYEATINGEPAEFVGGLPHIRRLAAQNLGVNSTNILQVKARDSVGNEISKSVKFNFANFDFSHKAIDTSIVIEPARIELTQTEGLPCIYASSPELASIYSISSKYRGCTINWSELPQGMEPVLPIGKGFTSFDIAQGVMASEGSYPYKFDVNTHDYFGDSLKVFEGTGNVNILPIQKPELIVGTAHIAENYGENYVYSKNFGRQYIIPYQIKKSAKASVTAQLIDPDGNVVMTKEHNTNIPDFASRFSYLSPNETPLSLSKYTVRTFYTSKPDLYAENSMNLYSVPPPGIRLYANHERTILENSTFQIFANIAQPVKGQLVYTPDMGEWDVYLAKYENRNYVPVTEKKRTDANGQVEFTFDANEISKDEKLQIVADFVSPYPEVTSRRTSNSLVSVNVLRLSGISAELTTPEVTLPLPAHFVVKTEFLQKIDKESSRSITWQLSDDGSTWNDLGSKTGLIYTHTMTEAKSQFVRAVLVHAITNDVSYTNVIKLTAYNKPELNLTGNTTVVAGALVDFYHSLTDYTVQQAKGEVEWSLDDEISWQPMDEHERITVDKDKLITARILVQSEDGTEPDYYVFDSINVKAIEPVLLKPIVTRSAYRLENGEKVDFTAKLKDQPYYPADSIRFEFVLPSGQTVADTKYSHVMAESDFVNKTANFEFKAWVDGLKEQTITTIKLPIKQIIYEFPESRVELSSPTKVVNSTFTASVESQTSGLPANVDFDVEWFLPEGVQVVKTFPDNRRISLSMTIPGVHNIKATFSDNRGNSIEHAKLIEAINPPPMQVQLSGVASNEYMRPPLNYYVRSKVALGHTQDSISKYQWSLNGEEVTGAKNFINNFEFTKPGTYTMSVLIESEMGQTHTETMEITVQKNKLPKCQPFTEVRNKTLVLNANCVDEDGRIARIQYEFDDGGTPRVFNTSSQTILFNTNLYPAIDVKIKAFDDSDDFVESRAQYSGN